MKLPFRKPAAPQERRRAAIGDRPQAFTYHTLRSSMPAAAGRRRLRDAVNARTASRAARFSLQRFGLLAVIIAVSISVVSILTLTPDPKVLPLDPGQTAFLHSTATYQQAAAKLFGASFASRNKITVDTAAIGSALQHEFPELASVTIKLPLIGHRPIVYIAPTQAVLALMTTANHVYEIDASGRALAQTSGTAEAASLVPVKDNSGAPVHVGQPALASDTVSFIQAVLYQMQHKQLDVSTFVLPAGESELDMYVAGQPYFVKFNLADDTPVQQTGTFLAVRHQLQGQGTAPLQYIDVRLAGRAYYR